MESELLKIFDRDRKPIGTAIRSDVHKFGYWHEGFHCWFVSSEKEGSYIYFQLRSKQKKDYPNLLDITAAGHLLAHETMADGVREIHEELGINVSFEDLIPLGIIDYCVEMEGFIDKELANIFLYHSNYKFEDYKLQKEEVSGVYRAPFQEFSRLWLDERDKIEIEGFEINKYGNRILSKKLISKENFVPHEVSYYKKVINLISNNI